MNYKKKAKIEQVIFCILTIIGFYCIGGSVGYFLAAVQKNMGEKMSGLRFGLMAISALVLIFLAYCINICLHEIGHLIFGLLTGYKFSSLRFGKLMLVKENGKLHFCRFNMPGTGGQCIMSVPETDAENMPVILYNLGGLLMNLMLFLIGAGIFWGMKTSHPIVGMISLMFALTSLVILITNGIPFSQMGTDGANTIILYKDKNARTAFRNQMEVIKYLADNCSIQEMPAELFMFDKSIPMTNPLITAQAVNCYSYLSANKRFGEAKDMALFILENAESINQLHETLLNGDLIFMAAVIDKNAEYAREQFKAHKKELKNASGFISVQRVLYAYYSLVEVDEKKASNYAGMFDKSVKNYPYPKDAAIEKEQFDMVVEALREKESGKVQ